MRAISKPPSRFHCLIIVMLLALCLHPAWADEHSEVMNILHMADYVGVDYAGAVENGRAINPAEYQEQLEFVQEIHNRVQALPPAAQAGLLTAAQQLEQAVRSKADAREVNRLTAQITQRLLGLYPQAFTPRTVPDLAHGQALFQTNCVMCHGSQGLGDGPAATGLEPAPTNFHEPARRDQRSLLSLYSTLTLGVPGTAMASYAKLSDEDRWALAFYVGQLGYAASQREAGRALWQQQAAPRAALHDLAAVAQAIPAELRARYGEDGVAMLAYLRAEPQVLQASMQVNQDPIAISQRKLRESITAYAGGDQKRASELAISAYLEGFELAEARLTAVDGELMRRIEQAMMAQRELIRRHAPAAEVSAHGEQTLALLDQAATRLAQKADSNWSTFTSSFIILAREGLEAILVLAAMFAFLKKSGRSQDMRYLHMGWSAALLLGLLTWVAATYLVEVSGAQRELTEGSTALLATAMLVFMGLWLHNKSYAGRWQEYVSSKMRDALSTRSRWSLALVAFIAVYREIFETVLFYRAIWEDGSHLALLLGIAVAIVALLALALALFRYSVRLPIRQFFSWSSIFIAVLAVVFAGKGIAALQEAGVLNAYPVKMFSLPLLGIYPNLQALTVQGLTLALTLAGFAYNHWSTPSTSNRMADSATK